MNILISINASGGGDGGGYYTMNAICGTPVAVMLALVAAVLTC
jgi:hypothetical protein